MGRRLKLVLALLTLAASESATGQECTPARTALVLSGGGTKGFAHIGVMQVLDSMGVKPDLIVGTSIGAILGSLYASGYSASQIDSLMRALPLASVIRRYEPIVSSSLGLLRPIAVWERGTSGYAVQTGAVREGEANALMASLMLRGNVLARGDFDSLPIPFRAVATNIVNQKAVILSKGDLARAVRASSALPLVFRAVHFDTLWLSDGALSSNVPVWEARELGAQRIWVSRLPSPTPDPNSFEDPLSLTEALLNTLFREDSIAPRFGDVQITSPTTTFQNLDLSRSSADSLIKLGHEAARAAFAAAPCVRPLGTLPPRLMPTHVASVSVRGSAVDGNVVIAGLGIAPGTDLNLQTLEEAITALGHSERYRGLWLNPSGSGASVSFSPELEAAPRRSFGVGVAFDQFMSGRLWLGGIDRSFFNGNAEGAALVRLGSYAQDLSAFIRKRARVRRNFVPITLAASLAHESVRLFEGSSELPSAETQELGGFLGLRDDAAIGQWRYEVGVDARLWREPGRAWRGSPGLRASLFRARNDHEMGTVMEVVGLADYQRVRVDATRTINLFGLEARGRLRAGWGNRLPVQHTFTLGGDDGFAGLRIGEIRGSQEGFASLAIRRSIAPLFRLRVEGMAGAIGRGDGFLRQRDSTYYGRVYGGVRFGFETPTPIGPIRVEEGLNNAGTRALLFRLGYWF
jgi:predicted acylesterase/phospholipase RssA